MAYLRYLRASDFRSTVKDGIIKSTLSSGQAYSSEMLNSFMNNPPFVDFFTV